MSGLICAYPDSCLVRMTMTLTIDNDNDMMMYPYPYPVCRTLVCKL